MVYHLLTVVSIRNLTRQPNPLILPLKAIIKWTIFFATIVLKAALYRNSKKLIKGAMKDPPANMS